MGNYFCAVPKGSFFLCLLLAVSCANRPAWIDNPPPSNEDFEFFVGISLPVETEKEARSLALVDATDQFVRFCGLDVRLVERYLNINLSRDSQVHDPGKFSAQQKLRMAEAFVSRIRPEQWHLENTLESGGGGLWKAYVLIKVPKDEIKRVKQYAREKKEEKLKPQVAELEHINKRFFQARRLLSEGRLLTALKIMGELKTSLAVQKKKAMFAKALEKVEFDPAKMALLYDRLEAGLVFEKISGDQEASPGSRIKIPLRVRAACRYQGREFLLNNLPVRFQVGNRTVATHNTDARGIAEYSGYLPGLRGKGVTRVLARVDLLGPRQVYFELAGTEEMAVEDETPDDNREISPDGRFVALEDGIVRDRRLGLVWRVSGTENKMDWVSAVRYCRRLGSGDYQWRLPSKKELASLIFRKGLDDCPYIYPIFQVNCGWYWTGEKRDEDSVWNVSFGSGRVYWSHPDYDNVGVLAVANIEK